MTSTTGHIAPPRMPTMLGYGLAAATGVLAAMSAFPLAVATFAVTIVAAALLLVPFHDRYAKSLLFAYVGGLLLRAIVMVALYAIYVEEANPAAHLYRDSVGYHRVASQLAPLIRGGGQFRAEYHTTAEAIPFHYWIAMVYAALGVSAWTAKMLTVVEGAVTVLLTFTFARYLVGSLGAVRSAWMYALWPTAIFWSAQILKDQLVGTLMLAASVAWLEFVKTRRWWFLLVAVLLITPMFWMRIYIFGFFGLGMIVALMVDLSRRGYFLVVVGLVVTVVLFWRVPFQLGLIEDPAILLFKLAHRPNPASDTNSMVSGVVGGAGIGPAIPFAMIKFLFSPLPWKATGPDLFTVPGVVLQYAIFPFAVRGGWLLMRQKTIAVLPFIVLTALTDLLYAIIFLGAIPRHMHMFYPYMFVCAIAGMQGWRDWALPWALSYLAILGAAIAATLL